MTTVPGHKLSPLTAAEITWAVRPSEFPFGVSKTLLGTVHAPDRSTAQQKAEDHYGRGVVVERLSKNVEKPEAKTQ